MAGGEGIGGLIARQARKSRGSLRGPRYGAFRLPRLWEDPRFGLGQVAVRCWAGLVFGNWVCLVVQFWRVGAGAGRQAGRGRATAGAADCVVADGGNWVRLVHRFGEFGCVGSFGGEAAAGAGKAADLKTEIRATGLRRSWACKLLT